MSQDPDTGTPELVLPDGDLDAAERAFARRIRAFARERLAEHARRVDEVMEFRRDGHVGDALGYLLLDAFVGNTDRHHENWGVLVAPRANGPQSDVVDRYELAPTFDHASSLGRELSDDTRRERLSTRDQNRTVDRYCARGRSPFFGDPGKPALSPRASFAIAACQRPTAAALWKERLLAFTQHRSHLCVERVPAGVMSPDAKRFACAMLDCNRQFLLETSPQ
jgi:hypothetical protein